MEAVAEPTLQDQVTPLIERAVKDFEPHLRKAADDLYSDLLYNVQDYLLDNTLSNIQSQVQCAERQATADRQALRYEQARTIVLEAALRKLSATVASNNVSAALLIEAPAEWVNVGQALAEATQALAKTEVQP